MNFNQLIKDPIQFRAVSTLTIDEFYELVEIFSYFWEVETKYKTFSGKQRFKKLSPNTKQLATIEEKLLFILIFFKSNPTQHILGAMFEMSQSAANHWIKRLLPLLEKSLKELKMLPERNPQSVVYQKDKELLMDATERPISRSTDNETQQFYYSGKKKRHTVKNNLVVTPCKLIRYLGKTWEGKKNDKKIAEEEKVCFRAGITLRKDLGYIGYIPDNVHIIESIKKKKGVELTACERLWNRVASSARVAVEHAISGVKRCRIVQEINRLRIEQTLDSVMVIACGLHNFRVSNRTACNLKNYP